MFIKLMKRHFLGVLIAFLLALSGIGCGVSEKSKDATTLNKTNEGKSRGNQGENYQKLLSSKVNLCELFPKEKISELLGKPIVKTKIGTSEVNPAPSCFYYLDGSKTVYLELGQNSNPSDQIKGAKALGWKVEDDPKILLKNWVVYNQEGKVYLIYLVIDEKTFITINPWGSGLTNEEEVDFASRLAKYLKDEFGVK